MSKKKKYVDIMIDIETLGKGPRAAILSIGGVVFDIKTGDIKDTFYKAASLESCLHEGMEVDSETILWWLSNDLQEVRVEIAKECGEDAQDIMEVLCDLFDFIESHRKDGNAMRVWFKPPHFDAVIIESAFDLFYMELPWKYYELMDLRTLTKIYTGKKPEFQVEGNKHNALYDATLQAKICSHIWNWVNR